MPAVLLALLLTISSPVLTAAVYVAPRSVEHVQAMPSSLRPAPGSNKFSGEDALRRLSLVQRPDGSSDEQVVVNRDTFVERIRGRKFQRWRDFEKAAGNQSAAQSEVGGEERLTGGLSLAFVIILNVLVWCFVGYIISVLSKTSERLAAWVAFGILCTYGFIVNMCCWKMYQDPKQRLITNFIFGLVPLAVSSASYVLALLVFDAVRSPSAEEGGRKKLRYALNPFQQIFVGRLIFCLAVLPGLATSVYLSGRVSTGFAEEATHFDVLSLCLFIDSGRFAGHFFYLIAPEWSIGLSPTSITSRPGVCYVIFAVCLAWYFVLLCVVAGNDVSFLVADSTKIHTLVCLTTTVFVPLSLYLEYTNLEEYMQAMPSAAGWFIFWRILSVLQHAIFMLIVGVMFDAIYPNLVGIVLLLWAVFYTAFKLSGGSLAWFILALLPLAIIAFGVLFLASAWGTPFRNSILHSASSSRGM